MAEREDLVERLARAELRLEQLEHAGAEVPCLEQRIGLLEGEVSGLRDEVAGLRQEVAAIRPAITKVLKLVEWGGGVGGLVLVALQVLQLFGAGR